MHARNTSQTPKIALKPILLWICVVLIVIFFLAPILWQVLTSVKLNEDISAIPTVYFPKRITLQHYRELFTRRPFAL
ncbi:MAG: carbohydrate ABC transporter permease, partial [Cyanobacteriota bacterium]|nr:carbohydrate ABC transporter permease [Cyanobacteriota bacterium]